MTVPRASGTLGRAILRRTTTQTRSQAWRQIRRRTYASEHGGQKSSELPWIIGSVGFTLPAAVWLFGQGPQKGVHHPEKAEALGEEGEADKEDSAEDADAEEFEDKKEATQETESKQDGADSDESKEGSSDEKSDDESDADADTDNKDDKKGEDKDDKKEGEDKADDKDDKDDSSKSDDGHAGRKLSDDGYELPGPNAPGQINKSKPKGRQTETPREKNDASASSGAQNPYLDDDEKGKKGVGLKDTAKIHGTVDSRQPVRGDGKDNE